MTKQNHTAFLRVLKRNIAQWIRHKDWQHATEGLTELQHLDPLAVETRGLELDFLVARHQNQDAQVLAGQLVHLFPESSRIQYLAGLIAYRNKEYPQALGAFEQSHRLYVNWRTERYMGKTLTQMGVFDRAEPLLLRLLPSHPICLLDLAWLYERKQRFSQAQKMTRQYLDHFPDNNYANKQLQRLQAHVLSSEQVLEEVETLNDFDQKVPIGLLEEYIKVKLSRGEGEALRHWLLQKISDMDSAEALQLGWVCHHRKAYDLAFVLFIKDFAGQCGKHKYRAALELAADRAGKLEQLINIYEQSAEDDKRFYGRATQLRKKVR